MKGTLIVFGLISVLLWQHITLADVGTAEENTFTTGKYKYFIESEQKYTWEEALEECKTKNMDLVALDTEAKSKDVQNVLNEAFINKKKPIPRLYIGAKDTEGIREFIWVKKEEILTYTNWEATEPNNFQGLDERCVHIGFHGDAKWNDVNCSRKYGFICEKTLAFEDLVELIPKA